MHKAFLLGLTLHAATLLAAPLPPTAKAEVDAVLNRLASSGCQFERNGTWYGGAEARTHLLRKLEYLEKNATLASAEKFIELAATSSSASGKPYAVRCGQDAPVASAAWLLQQLKSVRAAGTAAAGK